MLNLRGDDVLAPFSQLLRGGKDRPVVGLCAAGGEEDPIRLRAEGLRHGKPRRLQLSVGLHAQTMQGAGIAPAFGQCLGHCRDCLLTGLRRGGIVKICDHSLLLIALFPHAEPLKDAVCDVLAHSAAR